LAQRVLAAVQHANNFNLVASNPVKQSMALHDEASDIGEKFWSLDTDV
jgi:hypothetical protein